MVLVRESLVSTLGSCFYASVAQLDRAIQTFKKYNKIFGNLLSLTYLCKMLNEIIKVIKKGDYLYGKVKEHPNATNNKYVLLHRLIVENEINRYLEENEVVHHKNENKKDNRIENLEILSNIEHNKLHGDQKGQIMVELICPNCNKVFIKRRNSTFIIKKDCKYTFCSRKCSGIESRRSMLTGVDEKKEPDSYIIRIFNSLSPHINLENISEKIYDTSIYLPDYIKEIEERNKSIQEQKIKNKEYKEKERLNKPPRFTKEQLEPLIESLPIIKIAKMFNISDTAIIKWCKKLNIKRPGRGYWEKIYHNKL